jgi:hypothetical protein
MRWKKRSLTLMAVVVPIGGLVMFHPGGVTPVRAFDPTKAPEIQDRLLDATADIELGYNSPVAKNPPPVKNYSPHGANQCSLNLGSNTKVNQNCLNIADPALQGRSQAQNETGIAINPGDAKQLVASENDYRRGDGTCGVQYSNDGGKVWQDATAPNGFVRGTAYGAARQYYQAGGDTSVAWDTKGNAYLSCQEFQRGAGVTPNSDLSVGMFVYRSTGNGGASWSFPGTAVVESPDTSGSGSQPFLDKQYMTVDNHPGSPFQDRVYVTWTTFDANGSAYLYGAHSSDYGRSFSSPVLVSTASPLCTNNFGAGTISGNNCNENQFSDPFTGVDGSLYVVYANYNNSLTSPSDNHNQMLLVKSTDGGATFSAPVLVGNYYDLPDCATYQGGQDLGRSCIPEQGSQQDSVFRATNLPSGAVNPTDAGQVVVSFGSYINSFDAGACTPNGLNPDTGINRFNGVKSSACANKILLSVSSNGGTSFPNTDPTTLTTVNGADQATSDQWWQWSAFSKDGKIVVSYYDRQYGADETNGNMDFTLSSSQDPTKNQLTFKQKRVTSSSMPLPTQFTNGQGNSVFFGDYTGLAAWDQAYPFWMDTRDVDLFDCGAPGPPVTCTGTEPNGRTANDEDVFIDRIGL